MRTRLLVCAIAIVMTVTVAGGQEPLRLTIDSGQVVHRIDEKVYGHFLEHIYNSCNGVGMG